MVRVQEGWTALHAAVYSGRVEVLRLLLSKSEVIHNMQAKVPARKLVIFPPIQAAESLYYTELSPAPAKVGSQMF